MQLGKLLFGLAAPLTPQIAQAAAHAELAVMLVNQLEIETEMRRQRIGTESIRRNLPSARIEPA